MNGETEIKELYNRIYAYGGKSEDERFTLSGTTRIAPDGYILNTEESYLEMSDSVELYGLMTRSLVWTEASTPDELFDMALDTLRQHASPVP